jgi:isopentenyldiphosphate isomerase
VTLDELIRARERLAAAVQASDHCLTDVAYHEVQKFFGSPAASPANLACLAPEIANTEYLLNIDGRRPDLAIPFSPSESTCRRLEQDAKKTPLLAQSLNTAKVDGTTVALVNRWFAHFAGFRHRVVHVFLAHPTRQDCLFVQIRSYTKINAPGCFDVAIGGHVTGTASESSSVANEIQEELALDAERDLEDLRFVSRYQYCGRDAQEEFINIESRAIYSARLAPGAIDHSHFPDGEVAALCMFSHKELVQLMDRQPGQIASGLRESFSHYDRH